MDNRSSYAHLFEEDELVASRRAMREARLRNEALEEDFKELKKAIAATKKADNKLLMLSACCAIGYTFILGCLYIAYVCAI